MNRLLPLLFALACSPLAAAPVPLFDGNSLEGWDYDPKIWRVEDGMITGGSTTEKIKANYFIATKKSYANFELRLKIKCSGDPATGMINSGIQIRSVRVPGGHHMSGYQVDCGAGWFGKIYDEFRRNRVIATPVDQAALNKVVDVFGWNEYRIRAEGPRIQTWINGVLAIDYTETDPNIALDGQIGPQVHSGGVCLVQVKDVTIEELPPTPGAPTWESLGGVEAARKLVAPPPKKQGAGAPSPPVPPPAKPAADVNSRDRAQRTAGQLAIATQPRTAAEQQRLFHLPDGYEIELVVQESDGLGKFVSVYFDQRGRMWTQTAFEYPVDGNENPAAAEALYKSPGKDKVVVYPREALNAPLPPGGLTNPTVFADGLAIPLGILPWGAGDTCYIQHGPDLKLFKDTDGDGRADTSEIILTGFGVQDSHLFPHQFTRAPGGWIWMAQGLFNHSKAQQPGSDKAVDWPKCSMAKMRPDGSQFEVTSTGPNNIWGLVITGEGEAFIQEANDYGYPVMPFHEYAYYPGGMEALRKSYQPEFPPQADFRMGGTGLSGLALLERGRPRPPGADAGEVARAPAYTMLVANPIISKVQTIAMHRRGGGGESGGTEDGRAGPRWRLEQLPDLVTCDDPFFRPVALTNGPDGCIYIVDWYNKIISHNEVPRAHPDRDKTRGRIWRIVPHGARVAIPDFTKLTGDELIAKLGAEPLAQSHLAWQRLSETEKGERVRAGLKNLIVDRNASASRRIQALWSYQNGPWDDDIWIMEFPSLARDPNPVLRRALAGMDNAANTYTPIENAEEMRPLFDDADPVVRAEVIRILGNRMIDGDTSDDSLLAAIKALVGLVKPALTEPVVPSSRNGKPIKVREAYDRDFERYLIRRTLEPVPRLLTAFLDSPDAANLPIESRLLATLALEPKASAARVAKLLPQLQRAPGQAELLRLAQFPDEPSVGEALRAALNNPATRTGVLEALLATRTKLDAAKLTPVLTDAAKQLLADGDEVGMQLGIQLAGAFQLASVEATLVAVLSRVGWASRPPDSASRGIHLNGEVRTNVEPRSDVSRGTRATAGKMPALPILDALAALGSTRVDLFSEIATRADEPAVRDAALLALASSRAADAPQRMLALFPQLTAAQRKTALDRLASTQPGAKSIVAAITAGTVKKDELDGPTVEKLQAVLGNDPALTALLGELASLFRPVLVLDGRDHAWTETGVTLDGPFTVECWVRLEPGITNDDGILGAPGQLDMNFFQSKFRVWVGGGLHDVAVSSKPVTAGLWTHVAAVRDAHGRFRLYQDGELSAEGTKVAPRKFENVRIGWTQRPGGTAAALDEFRIWNVARTAEEIRRDFDRQGGATFLSPTAAERQPPGAPLARTATGVSPLLVRAAGDTGWGKLQPGAKIARTSDFAPILTADEAAALDAKFARYRALALQPGDAARGQTAALLCSACHLFKGQGGSIGPDLSGIGAMGTEAILRNLLQPNAAMEAGYRIYRVELKNGDLVDAFFVSEDKDAVVVRLPGAPDRRIARSEIRSAKYLRRSLMPEGLLDALPPQQVSDLFAYLLSLK